MHCSKRSLGRKPRSRSSCRAPSRAREENQTVTWYAFQAGPRTFGIFDSFRDETGRTAPLQGRIAQALMGKAEELLATPPDVRKVDLLAVK